MKKLESANLEDDKYELQGWINDIDENEGGNNLLKILENKITVPFFQKTINLKVQSQHKLKQLPLVKPIKKRSVLERVLSKNNMNHQPEANSDICSLKNSQSEKIMGISANLEQGLKMKRYMKEPIWVKNQRFLELFKNKKTPDGETNTKKVNCKHKRLESSISLPIKEKSNHKSIFPKLRSEKLIHTFELKGKPFSYDKEYFSNQKECIRNIASVSSTQKIGSEQIRVKESFQVRIKNIFPEEVTTKMTRVKTESEKPKSKICLNNFKLLKIAKTENCYFMDEHLQSPRQKR